LECVKWQKDTFAHSNTHSIVFVVVVVVVEPAKPFLVCKSYGNLENWTCGFAVFFNLLFASFDFQWDSFDTKCFMEICLFPIQGNSGQSFKIGETFEANKTFYLPFGVPSTRAAKQVFV